MACFDVFNGDADGICALHQLRLAEPLDGVLITGIKRDIGLLHRVEAAAGDRVTVLDISLAQNREALDRLLERGVSVRYFDHHFAGDIPKHPLLQARIDTAPDVCTSLLVDRFLDGRFRPWAVAAAFGDNLHRSARLAAQTLSLDEAQLDRLRELGVCLNYNGYGESLDDLFYHPAELYRRMRPYTDPFAFVAEEPAFAQLRLGYREDMQQAGAAKPLVEKETGAIYVLPDTPWSRRASGVFANDLATAHPRRAHAVLSWRKDGSYTVSVRSPLSRQTGADELCRQFENGGGRQGAAGISGLPAALLDRFIERFFLAFA
ncbi:MAG: DHH family phosphoesterase [Sulfuricellaceae bacterium]|nr:DHH family phosphoesterase [Sulfuricellaceae bacterium]